MRCATPPRGPAPVQRSALPRPPHQPLKPGGSQVLSLDSTGKVNGVYFEAKNGAGKTIAKGQLGQPRKVYAFG